MSKTISVDISLEEFDDDALIEELEDRGYQVVGSGAPDTRTIYEALKRGDPRADEMMRAHILNACGKVCV